MAVLVTGATGFIGQHLMAALISDQCPIHVLTRDIHKAQALWNNDLIKVFQIDSIDQNQTTSLWKNVEIVFHLACGSFAENDMENYQKSIVMMTQSLLTQAIKAKVKQFIFVSSVKAMGEKTEHCLNENSPALPETAYGKAKLTAEQQVLAAGKDHIICSSVLRLPMVYGKSTKSSILQMVRAIYRGYFPSLSKINNHRSMVHVLDVVQAMMLIARNPKISCQQAYLVTDGQSYSTDQIYALICHALNRTIPRWCIPIGVLIFGARIGDFIQRIFKIPIPLNPKTLDKLTSSAWYSTKKIQTELGYRPQYSLTTALPEIIDQVKQLN
ncbi:NAD-dependent epimerase/dehydratase family protein [Candidatus Nitrosacidococcus sp. I8]|uniref:NAD-dependent epimerase/dehydratase family protein n=1 Tax=Candidatus Nitrosacidococcus sp. I8 TaxID=2942908 RepID=UPI002226D514|nr:NAD-dependent epimerase/dehydratase family protein [Candidatus Nitrosacidococcus sp. I8]CAH9014944.1 N-acetyl-alpha-D-glucosaminyl-diphospho-ditrans, octacis-undecaprenol 4-epimerase [Candidatus Nitrosacidococcus sp. I8]